jgi:outer membrane protein assembly factor BamB
VAERKPAISTHSTNTYASETPVIDGERGYAYFGMSGLYCLSAADGKVLWEEDLGVYRMMNGWGTGSSPLLDRGRLYVPPPPRGGLVVCYDGATGKEVFKHLYCIK